MAAIPPTTFRNNIYAYLDEVIESSTPLYIKRKGVILKLEPQNIDTSQSSKESVHAPINAEKIEKSSSLTKEWSGNTITHQSKKKWLQSELQTSRSQHHLGKKLTTEYIDEMVNNAEKKFLEAE